jgi:hypothetical protein
VVQVYRFDAGEANIYVANDMMGPDGCLSSSSDNAGLVEPTSTVWTIIEPFRLYYGISGNLREKVPEMATYLLMGIFPQLPLVIYLGYLQTISFPIDAILGTLMLLFLIAQFLLGFMTMRYLIRNQTAQFMRLCEDDD